MIKHFVTPTVAWYLAKRILGPFLLAVAAFTLMKVVGRDIWIGVWSQNFGAQRFYERRGYAKVGEYGFQVGGTTDHEFILKKDAAAFAAERDAAKAADLA